MMFISLIVWLSVNIFWGKNMEAISAPPDTPPRDTPSCPRGQHFVPDFGKCVRIPKIMTGGNKGGPMSLCPDNSWLLLHDACISVYRYVEGMFDCDTGNLLLQHIINCQSRKKPKKDNKKKNKCKGAKEWDPATKKCVSKTTLDPYDDIDE